MICNLSDKYHVYVNTVTLFYYIKCRIMNCFGANYITHLYLFIQILLHIANATINDNFLKSNMRRSNMSCKLPATFI